MEEGKICLRGGGGELELLDASRFGPCDYFGNRLSSNDYYFNRCWTCRVNAPCLS